MKELLRFTFDPPELSEEKRQTIPKDVLEVIFKGLSCQPEQRFADAAQMRDALGACAGFNQAHVHGAEAVRSWVSSLGIFPDEELSSPVIGLMKPSGDQQEVMWTAWGPLAPQQQNELHFEDNASSAQILSIPPLPPRRDEHLDMTADDDLTLSAPDSNKKLFVSIGLALMAAVIIYWALLAP